MHVAPILHFLKKLEAEAPPPAGQHHSLTYAQHGSDEVGWTDQLCLSIRFSNGSQNFIYAVDEELEAGMDEIREFTRKRR